MTRDKVQEQECSEGHLYFITEQDAKACEADDRIACPDCLKKLLGLSDFEMTVFMQDESGSGAVSADEISARLRVPIQAVLDAWESMTDKGVLMEEHAVRRCSSTTHRRR
jgi:hypothetical protein